MTNMTTRDMFIDSVYKYAADGKSNQPLGDWYATLDGTVEGFRARPVVGGHLALVSAPRKTPAVNVLIWSKACFVKLYRILRRVNSQLIDIPRSFRILCIA